MKVLPLKLSDHLYQDLKYVSQRTNTPMAQIIRNYFEEPVTKQAKKIKKKTSKKIGLYEFLSQNAYDGPIYNQDKTDDELVYGVKLK